MSQNECKQDKTGKFRMNSSAFFLTYPQCPASREVLRDMIESKATVEKGLVG